jgi:DNA-binding transcriptional MerR regulator
MALKKEKDLKPRYSIKEVAQMFGLKESTLRYWETKYDEISPPKTPTGTRYYTKKDIDDVRLIYRLVKERGLTHAGAQKKLTGGNKATTVNHEAITARLEKLRGELTRLADALGKIERTDSAG